MIIENKQNLPRAIVDAVVNEKHNEANSYSATTLLKGAKEAILTDRHFDEIKVDASDCIWQIFGTAVHGILQQNADGALHELALSAEVSRSLVTGVIDWYGKEAETVIDYKTASVWKIMVGDFDDWQAQGTIYAWLLWLNGFPCSKVRFVALLKDHSKSKASRDASYPQSPVAVYEFEVDSKAIRGVETFVNNRVKLFEEAAHLPDDEIEPCSAAERWADAGKYAVMKNGRKSAVRVFDSKDEADSFCEKQGAGHYVQKREAVSRKCEGYCAARDFCNYYKQAQAARETNETGETDEKI